MGVRITDKRNVALYCSTEGVAFGPVFEDEYEAQAFLDFLGERDARTMTPSELVREHCRFDAQREHTGTAA